MYRFFLFLIVLAASVCCVIAIVAHMPHETEKAVALGVPSGMPHLHPSAMLVVAAILLVLAAKIRLGDQPNEILACGIRLLAFGIHESIRWLLFARIELLHTAKRLDEMNRRID